MQCPQTTTFEEKGEPKRIQTEVPLLTSLTLTRRDFIISLYIRDRQTDIDRMRVNN